MKTARDREVQIVREKDRERKLGRNSVKQREKAVIERER